MGKWAARLAEKTAATPQVGTDKTDRTLLLSVLAVPPQGVADFFQAETGHTDLAPNGMNEAECERFAWRMGRLTRWGWPQAEAHALAERLTERDRTDDDRVNCTDCRHRQQGRCGNHRRAGLTGAEVGRDWAGLLQRCSGFETVR